jgi:hypothetical protein
MQVRAKLLPILVIAMACCVCAVAQGSKKGGGETTTGYGNNLSYPVVFAEGYGVTGLSLTSVTPWSEPFAEPFPVAGDNTGLRPLVTEEFSNFPSLVEPYPASPSYYAQGTVNTWRAEWTAGTPGTPEEVQVDWGDNLISQSWTATQPVRVETVLRQPISMVGFPMTSLLGSRRTETQGTTGIPEDSLGRTVYSTTAHLTIQKYDPVTKSVIPNGCSVDKTVYDQAADGPGGYAAEVNVVGSVIYGYNWSLSQCNAAPDSNKDGYWLITFKLDENANMPAGPVPRNVKIVGVADISSPITKVSYDDYSSSLLIQIVSTRPTGGKGRNR